MDNEGDAGSNIGSKRSTRAAGGGNRRLCDKLFPLLRLFHSPTSDTVLCSAVNIASLTVELLQQIGFFVQPGFGFTFPIASELAYVVYTTHVPLWDSQYADLSFTEYLPLYWLSVCLSLSVAVFLYCGYCSVMEVSRGRLTTCVAVLFQLVSGPLAVPMLHALMANMFCHDGHLWAFADQTCWEMQATLYFTLSLLVLFILCALMVIGAATLFDDGLVVRTLLSRAHARVHVLLAFQKIFCTLATHLLLGPGHVTAYCLVTVVLNFAMFAAYCSVMPYYCLRTNKFGAMCHAAAASAGLVALFCSLGPAEHLASLRDSDATALLVFMLSPMVALLGYNAGGSRVLNECVERMRHLRDFGEVFSHRCYFPAGLMRQEHVMRRESAVLERDILEAEVHVQEEGFCDFDSRSTNSQNEYYQRRVRCEEVLVPYIETVAYATDGEVATRFLLLHAESTRVGVQDGVISRHMTAFASRILLKTAVANNPEGITAFHFANFVRAFCPPSKLAFALEQCDLLVHGDVDFSTRFQAHRVHTELREQLGIHNQQHKFSLQRAKRLHREALNDMSTFWLKLMETKNDLMSLACLTNQITRKRNTSYLEYQRAIQDGAVDREALGSFASFLEFVMLDKASADRLQQKVQEMGEDMRNHLIQNISQRSGNSSRRSTRDLIPSQQEQLLLNHNSAKLMSTATVVVFCLIAFVSLVILGSGTLLWKLQESTFDKVYECGKARTLVQLASLQSLRVSLALNTESAKVFTEEQQRLQGITEKYATSHNSLMYGSLATSYGPIVDAYTEPRYMLHDCAGLCGLPTSVWNLGREAIGAFSAVSLASIENTGELELLASKNNRDMSFILSNARTHLAYAYNETVALYFDEHEMIGNWVLSAIVLCVVLVSFLFLALNVIFNLNFRKIGMNKVVAIHLFSLIPYPTQQQLHQASRSRLRDFTRQSKEADKGADHLPPEDLAPPEEEEGEVEDELLNQLEKSIARSVAKPLEDSVPHSKDSVDAGEPSLRKPVKGILKPPVAKRHKKKSKKKVTFKLPEEDVASRSCVQTLQHKLLVESVPVIDDIEAYCMNEDDKRELLDVDDTTIKEREAEPDPPGLPQSSKKTFHLNATLFTGLVHAAAFTLLFFAFERSSDALDLTREGYAIVESLCALEAESQTLRRNAAGAVQTGNLVDYWEHYWTTRYSSDRERMKKDVASHLREEPLLEKLWDVEKKLASIDRTEDVAMALALEGHGLSKLQGAMSFAQDLQSLDWVAASPKFEEYAEALRSYNYGYTEKTLDAAQSEAEKVAMAQRVITSVRYLADVRQATHAIGDLERSATELHSSRIDAKKQRATEFTWLSAVCFAVCFLVEVATIISVQRRKTMHLKLEFLGSFAFLLLGDLLAFVLLCTVDAKLSDLSYVGASSAVATRNATTDWLAHQDLLLASYLTHKDEVAYKTFWSMHDRDQIAIFADYVSRNGEGDATAQALALVDAANAIEQDQLICLEITSWTLGDTRLLPKRPEHDGLQWMWTAAYPSVWYNNTAHDRTLSTQQQESIVRSILYHRVSRTQRDSLYSGVTRVTDVIAQFKKDSSDSERDTIECLLYVLIGVCCFAFLAYGSAFVAVCMELMHIIGEKVTPLVARVNDALFSKTVRMCRVSFAVVYVLLILQAAVGIREVYISDTPVKELNLGTRREWAVARSALSAELLLDASKHGVRSGAQTRNLLEMIDELESTRNVLYKGANLDPITSAANVDRQYINWLKILTEAANIQGDTAAPPEGEPSGALATRPLVDIVISLRTFLDPLVDKLWQAADQAVVDGKAVCLQPTPPPLAFPDPASQRT